MGPIWVHKSVNNITALKVLKYIQEEFEDTKGVIRISVNRRIDNTMAKRTNKDLQNIHIKLKVE
jgi:hypothetical protein